MYDRRRSILAIICRSMWFQFTIRHILWNLDSAVRVVTQHRQTVTLTSELTYDSITSHSRDALR